MNSSLTRTQTDEVTNIIESYDAIQGKIKNPIIFATSKFYEYTLQKTFEYNWMNKLIISDHFDSMIQPQQKVRLT